MNGPDFAGFAVAAGETACSSLRRHGPNTLDLIVLEECLDVLHNPVARTAPDPDRYAQFAGNSFPLLVPELIESLEETVGQTVEHGIVVRGSNHVGISFFDFAAELLHIVLDFANVVPHASQACKARTNLLAGQGNELCFNTNCTQDLFDQAIGTVVLPGTSRDT